MIVLKERKNNKKKISLNNLFGKTVEISQIGYTFLQSVLQIMKKKKEIGQVSVK